MGNKLQTRTLDYWLPFQKVPRGPLTSARKAKPALTGRHTGLNIPPQISTLNVCTILKQQLNKGIPFSLPGILLQKFCCNKTHAFRHRNNLSYCLDVPSKVYLPSLIFLFFSSTWNHQVWVRERSLTFTASTHIHLLACAERRLATLPETKILHERKRGKKMTSRKL